MSFFDGNYLRVISPVTIDGINLAYENGRPKTKETHLPISAKKFLERKNQKLPQHLRKTIEVVDMNSFTPPAQPVSEAKKTEKPAAKRGPKKKIDESEKTESNDTESTD